MPLCVCVIVMSVIATALAQRLARSHYHEGQDTARLMLTHTEEGMSPLSSPTRGEGWGGVRAAVYGLRREVGGLTQTLQQAIDQRRQTQTKERVGAHVTSGKGALPTLCMEYWLG